MKTWATMIAVTMAPTMNTVRLGVMKMAYPDWAQKAGPKIRAAPWLQ